MHSRTEVVITGMGVVSPCGIGTGALWQSLREGRSGVGPITAFDPRQLSVRIGAMVKDFEPKQYVRPRKSLKVMSRDGQFAVTAANFACQQAALSAEQIDPERWGVVFGADRIRHDLLELEDAYRACMTNGDLDQSLWGTLGLAKNYPLGILKALPNMAACHVSILQDARGPNNTVEQAEVSSLVAIGEAARVIERGQADAMLAGGTSSRMNPLDWVRSDMGEPLSHRQTDPARASRPFDTQRDGFVRGEGAGVFVLESRRHAEARGAKILGRILGCSSSFAPRTNGRLSVGRAVKFAAEGALRDAGITPADLGHVNAHGLSTLEDDRCEAEALRDVVAETPVTAPKSYFGNLLAAAGAVEMATSLLSFAHDEVPVTLNCEQPDPECPIQIVRDRPLSGAKPVALLLNHTSLGQAAAIVIAGE